MNILYWNPQKETLHNGVSVGNILIGDVKYITIITNKYKRVNIIPDNVFMYTLNTDSLNNRLYYKDIINYKDKNYVILEYNGTYGIIDNDTFIPLSTIKREVVRVKHFNEIKARHSDDIVDQEEKLKNNFYENIHININIRNHYDYYVRRDLYELMKADGKKKDVFNYTPIKVNDVEAVYLERIIHYLDIMHSIYDNQSINFYLGDDFIVNVLSNKVYSLWKENGWQTKKGKKVINAELYDKINYYTNQMNVSFHSISHKYTKKLIAKKDALDRGE